jgi:hypothetical protein
VLEEVGKEPGLIGIAFSAIQVAHQKSFTRFLNLYMANLFWKTAKGTRALLDKPFGSEDEFERMVFSTSELLKDIFFLKRQIRGGNKAGIPDILGVDREGNVCIVEMKNTEVDADIIPQVLHYAFWAETNPDSVKSLWLECADKPEDIEINWDNLQVRILVIAPSIYRSTLDLVNRITYPVDLIEVKRWVEGENAFLFVNKLEPDAIVTRRRPVSGARLYDEAFYKSERNSKSVDEFMAYVNELADLVHANKWNLEMKLNRGYCGFKAGFFNAFGIGWWGTKSYGFFAKISKTDADKLRPKPHHYSHRWKEAYYQIEPGKTKVADLLPVFAHAYQRLAEGR